MILLVLVALLCEAVLAQNVTVCQDADTHACELLAASRSGFCDDEDLSNPICQRFCGHCPVVCYHCDASVTDYRNCTATKTCAKGETCMIKQLRSSADGHHEYIMSCEDKQVCDGAGLAFPFGRRDVESRDVSVHCCSDDLCNYPEHVTTTAISTTTTRATGCSRDIAFMIDTSIRVSSFLSGHGTHSSGSSSLKSSLQLVHDIVSQLNIGPYDNLVSLSTFDRSVHNQWDLDDHMNKNDLLHAISNVHQRVQFSSHGGDVNDAIQHLTTHVMDDHHGDRSAFPDDVILITDAGSAFHNTLLKHSLQRKSHDIIVISVGRSTSTSGTASDLATDAAHKIHVNSYAELSTIGGRLFQLLCT